MRPQTKRMVGTRISQENADELQLLASITNRSVSEIISIAVDDLLKNPSRVIEDIPAEAENFTRDHFASVDAAEYHVRRQVFIVAFHLTAVLLAAFASWISYERDQHQARTGTPFWEPSDHDVEIGYDVVGALMRNASWILESWFSGNEYRRGQVSEYLAGLTAQDAELAAEYEALLNKIDGARAAIEEVVGTRKE